MTTEMLGDVEYIDAELDLELGLKVEITFDPQAPIRALQQALPGWEFSRPARTLALKPPPVPQKALIRTRVLPP